MKPVTSALDRLIDKKCYDALYKALSDYIEDSPDGLDLLYPSNLVEQPDTASLIDMEVIRSANSATKDDNLFFDVIVSGEIEIEETVRRERETDSVTQWFKLQCEAVLDDGLKDFIIKKVEVYAR